MKPKPPRYTDSPPVTFAMVAETLWARECGVARCVEWAEGGRVVLRCIPERGGKT